MTVAREMRWVVDPATPGRLEVFESKRDAEVYALQHGGRISQQRVKIATIDEHEAVTAIPAETLTEKPTPVAKVAAPKRKPRPKKPVES